MHWIEQTFGTSDLYEILSCPRDANRGALRKAYYRAALQHHPDKSGGDPKRFQAVSLAYQILENADARSEYDETGVIPGDEALDDDDGTNQAGVDQWRQYFDRIFGRVTTSKIDAFAQKYKCSDEECRDVLAAFVKCKGNLVKMVDIVLVSEFRDADRWVSDFLQPALDSGTLDRKLEPAMQKSLKVCQKKAAQQDKEEAEEEEDEGVDDEDDDFDVEVDDEETETDESSSESEKEQKKQPQSRARGKLSPQKSAAAAAKKSPKKAGKTQAKAKKPKMDDLVAAIQNKRGGGGSGAGNLFASLGSRYGVNMDEDDDPLGGDKFEKAQTKMLQRGKGGRKK